jgi:hypothetical protein
MTPRNMTPESSRARISILLAATFAAGLAAGSACQKNEAGKTPVEPDDDVDAAVVIKKDAGAKDKANPSPDTMGEQPDMKGEPVDVAEPDVAAPDAGTDGPRPDASPDGYILGGPGPFGLMTRPSNQTCKPPASAFSPAMLLTATGCVDAKDPTKPAPGLIPYTVASPLWSDAAAKNRFMAIPDGTVVHIKNCTTEPDTCKPAAEGGTTDDEGHFEFPTGTVLMKEFLFKGKRFETRLWAKMSDALWVGYSYAWNAQQTEATLVDETGSDKPVMNDAGMMQSWHYPSRSECTECHNAVVGFSLGPEVMNFNIAFKYPSGVTANQLDTLAHIGYFDAPVKKAPPLLDPRSGLMGTVDDPATLEARARSYLQANCAICHRPEGNFQGLDMRFGIDLKAMNLCDVEPIKGTDPIVPANKAKRLVPGHPELSVMWGRMSTTDPVRRMPQIATALPDPAGTLIISDWIKSITKCP